MIKLTVDPNKERNEELTRCRNELKKAIDDKFLVLMVVRGSEDEKLAKYGENRSKGFADREIVWAKDKEILEHADFSHLFCGRGDDIVAVFIDLDNDPGAWLKADASEVQVDRAYRKAGRGVC